MTQIFTTPTGTPLVRLSEGSNDNLAASLLNLAVHEVGPPLQHLAPLGEILRAVVDAPHSLLLVGEGLFDPVGIEALLVELS
ncbi:hypothetical protein Atep_30920 (plasmid) [Allochromatium tepidum]|uniref:Uncharacterized protein n=1 Tax=Allochromatium tepidum TaxID=553982 RepID=A0ABM7QQU2_9GAMM|nr:hypothetical protein Atep_30920 [Allochromatium tepidum]